MSRDPVRALTIRQPFATLIANGSKRVETRGWAVKYRGWLLVHAGKGYTAPERELATLWPFGDCLGAEHHAGPLPLGAIVAVAKLTGCVPSGTLAEAIRLEADRTFGPWPEHELAFGDYSNGRFGWVLEQVTRLDVPVPATGAQGLWVPDQPTLKLVRASMRATLAAAP